MTQTYVVAPDERPVPVESAKPAICWAGVWSGVFVTLSLSAVLTILGAGLGFAVRSPWEDAQAAKTLGVVTIIWLILVQWISSSVGGYIAGRLRTRWVNVHTHEVFFRDTAHGFVMWAVANAIMIGLVMWGGAMASHHAVRLAQPAIYGAAQNMSGDKNDGMDGRTDDHGQRLNPMNYYSDTLFRTAAPATPAPDQDVRGEANRILMKAAKDGSLSEEDKNYLAQLVSARTGLAEADAKNRVEDVMNRINGDESQMREVADNARKTASLLSICIALSMLVGAFVASISAALGGNIRDRTT